MAKTKKSIIEKQLLDANIEEASDVEYQKEIQDWLGAQLDSNRKEIENLPNW